VPTRFPTITAARGRSHRGTAAITPLGVSAPSVVGGSGCGLLIPVILVAAGERHPIRGG